LSGLAGVAPFAFTFAGNGTLDLLHKSEKGEAFAKENPDVISNAAAQMLRPYNQKLTFARGLFLRKFW
jgi:hypothetical protein